MILDALLGFDNISAPRDLAQVAGTYASTNTIDWGIAQPSLPALSTTVGARDMGIGDHPALKFVVQVSTAFAGGTSLQVSIQGASDDGTGVPAAFSTWWSSPAYVTASLDVGSRLLNMDFPRPPDGLAVPRFVRLLYTIVGTMTAGKVVSYLVLDRDDQMYQGTNNAILGAYPAGINIAN